MAHYLLPAPQMSISAELRVPELSQFRAGLTFGAATDGAGQIHRYRVAEDWKCSGTHNSADIYIYGSITFF